jgi:signal peptidase II
VKGVLLAGQEGIQAQAEMKQEKPAWRSPGAVLLFLVVTLALLAADLWVKGWAFETVAGTPVVLTRENAQDPGFWKQYPHDTTVVVPKVLGLRLVTNKGAVFGIGQGKQYFFASVTVLAVAVIGWIFVRSPAKAWLTHFALAFILAGAVGNFYDRVVFGVVRDMFLLFPGTNIFPWVFNLADVFLDVGVALAVWVIFFGKTAEQPDGQDAPARQG